MHSQCVKGVGAESRLIAAHLLRPISCRLQDTVRSRVVERLFFVQMVRMEPRWIETTLGPAV